MRVVLCLFGVCLVFVSVFVATGDEIYCMAGTKENLKSRISKCSQELLRDSSVSLNEVIGALVVFCGGCMLQIEHEMDVPCQRLRSQLGGCPLLGFHTFGEVGQFADGQVMHGNLMFSVLLFTSRRKVRHIVSSTSGQVRTLTRRAERGPQTLLLNRKNSHGTSTSAFTEVY